MYSFHEGYQKTLGMDIEGIPNMTVGIKNAKPMDEIIDLSEKTAIVTGGAMGLGVCTVNRLCEAGAKVVIADIAEEFAEKALEYFSHKKYKVKFIQTDVRYVDQIQEAVDFTIKEFGSIDILVNCAASWSHNLLSEVTEETWNEIIDINLKGTLFFIKATAREMEKQGNGGKIVNVASVAGLSADPAPIMFEYVASKSGVIGMTKSLARALKPLNININCVIPGGMYTPGAFNTHATDEALEIRKNMVKPPTADPDEVARLVFMMATQIGDYMHGSTLVADGGACLGLQ